MFSTIGFAPTFPVLLILAAAAGIGSGCYHPLGALNANAVIPTDQRNVAMSVYVTGGTMGVALGPIIGAVIFSLFGVHGTVVMFFPGICSAIWLLFEMRKIAVRRPAPVKPGTVVTHAPIPIGPLLAIIGVMASRSWTVIGIEAFIPTWYKSLGYSASFYGPLATVVVVASAFGTIGSGTLADRYGRRAVIVGALILTMPVIILFAQFTGPIGFLTGAGVGFLAASTGPLMLVMAQQLMAGRAGMASGLILGLGFVTGAIGVPIMGAMADAFGIAAAMRFQAVIVLVTIAVAFFLPSEEYLFNRTREIEAASHPTPGAVPATANKQ
jgi:FSR family fosmidomycin resistance protein-like MFS transporter